MATYERAGEVEALLECLTHVAEQRPDVRALALVGSWAYGAPHSGSDVDVVLLTESPANYIYSDEWLAALGDVRPVRTLEWGVITERRFALPSGLELDVGVGTPAWASAGPLDAGTLQVVADGMRALYDPEGLLAAVAASCGCPRNST